MGPAGVHHPATPGRESKEDTMDGKPGWGEPATLGTAPGSRPGSVAVPGVVSGSRRQYLL